MGVVYAAYDPALRRDVALKLVHPERTAGTARARLIREAQALAKVSHPNVVQIFDVGMEGDQVFLAMEFVQGQTLADWLEKETPGWRAVVRAFIACAHGLHAAHEVGLVHRDFKPRNVLVGEDGRPRVADFGLAGLDESPGGPPESPETFLDAAITRTGSRMGTPRYMAPEQHRGEEVGAAADQFSLCVALFESLYGAHPFSDARGVPTAARVRAAAPRKPPSLRGPRGLRRVIERGLALKPEDRHPSTLALARALLRVTSGRRRRNAVAAVSALLVAGLAISALYGSADEATCTAGAEQFGVVWDEERRQAVRSALSERSPVALERLDDYSRSWIDAHVQMCGRADREEISGSVLDASMLCLRSHRAAFDATVRTLSGGDDEALALAWRATAALPVNARCTDPQQLARENARPHDPYAAGRVQLVREQLARTRAQHTAGDVETAFATLSLAEQAADALDYAPLTTEVGLVRGQLAMDVMDWDTAETALARAIDSGLAANEDVMAAEAAARRVFVLAINGAPEALETFVPMATALVERAGSPPGLAALLANNIGVAHIMVGEYAAADTAFGEALDAASAAKDLDPLDRSGFLVNIAVRTPDIQQRDSQLREAFELATRGLGPEHPRTLEIEFLRAQSVDDPTVALERLGRVCPRLEARAAVDWTRALQCRWLEAELQDDAQLPGATASLRHALAFLDPDAHDDARQELEAQRALTIAYLDILEGRSDDASKQLRASDAYFASLPPTPWVARKQAAATLLFARLPADLQPHDIHARLEVAAAAFELRSKSSYTAPARHRHRRALALLAAREAQSPEGRSIP